MAFESVNIKDLPPVPSVSSVSYNDFDESMRKLTECAPDPNVIAGITDSIKSDVTSKVPNCRVITEDGTVTVKLPDKELLFPLNDFKKLLEAIYIG